MAQSREPVDEPTGQARHPLMDQVHPDAVDPGQSGLEIRYLQEAERAVLEAGLVRGRRAPVALHGDHVNGPASEPGTPEATQRFAPRDEALDQFRRSGGGRVFRMRVPEAPAAQPLGMRLELRLRRQARTGVVEVGMPACVEVGVLGRRSRSSGAVLR